MKNNNMHPSHEEAHAAVDRLFSQTNCKLPANPAPQKPNYWADWKEFLENLPKVSTNK